MSTTGRRCVTGEPPGGVRDRPPPERAGKSRVHREVGSDRRHLPLHAELQRRATDLCSLRQQLRVSPQENMGETLQAGGRWCSAT